MLQPVHDHLIVEPVDPKETATASGIILPDTVDKEKPEQGKVVAVGPGKLLENGTRAPMSAKVGDIVVFKKYAPDEVKIKDKEFLVIADSDVLGIITE